MKNSPIAVLWSFPRSFFFLDYPELRGRRILFITDRYSLTQLYGYRDLQYIIPNDIRLSMEIRSAFAVIIKGNSFREYKKEIGV